MLPCDEEDDDHDQALLEAWCSQLTTPPWPDFDLTAIASVDELTKFIARPLPYDKRIPALLEWKREFKLHRCPDEKLQHVFVFVEPSDDDTQDNGEGDDDDDKENSNAVDNNCAHPANTTPRVNDKPATKEIIWELKSDLLNLFFGQLAREKASDKGNEDYYHCVMDCRILNVLRTPFTTKHAPGRLKCREFRNDHSPIFTRGDHQRLDAVITLNEDPVFVGEEKLPGKDPRESLQRAYRDLQKVVWVYGNIPWILGYASAGYRVDLVAVAPARETRHRAHGVVVEKIAHFDLQKPWQGHCRSEENGRLELLLALLNIASILPCLEQQIKAEQIRQAQANPSLRRYDDVDQEFFEIIKTLEALEMPGEKDTKAEDKAQVFPLGDVDVLANEQHRQALVSLIGEPYQPQNVVELQAFVQWVMATLSVLHDAGIIHRNTQHWESYRCCYGQWFLANFKDAATVAKARTRKCEKLAKANEASFPELANELRRGTTFIVDHLGLACLVETWFRERHLPIKWHARRLVQSLKKTRRKTLSQETKNRLQVPWSSVQSSKIKKSQ